MLEIYICALVIVLASLAVGGALLRLLGWPRPLWLAGASGFAVLVVLAPFLIRLPGRGTSAAILLGLLALLGAAHLYRERARAPGPAPAPGGRAAALATTLALAALAALPFLLHGRIGILGEGIYTNDHAAQLYWADWLQNAFGPQPSAVRFGYPIGPQALVAVVSTATTIDLVAAFNGLLVAIVVLTGLTALGALGRLALPARVAVATLTGLTYLGASFLAQSAFKETAMALFVLAFAIALGSLSGPDPSRRGGPPRSAVLALTVILATASVLTFSLPGMLWIAVALPLWLLLEARAGRSPIDWAALAGSASRHRRALAAAGLAAAVIAALAIGPAISFIDRIGDVSESQGRLSSPIFPGEVFGVWPEGDYRIVRGEIPGSLIATAIGLLAALYGAWALLRRRQLALLATLAAGLLVYLGTRLFAHIHVEAKALAVIAPLVALVALRGLLEPAERDRPAPGGLSARARYPLGALLAVLMLGSSVLALRAAPVGFGERGAALERLAERAEGAPLVFLGLDRFGAYWLREALTRAPGGYVPQEVPNRPEKLWQQGRAVDFDNLESRKLDRFRYAITTSAAYASAPPPNFTRVAEDSEYILWRRQGRTPPRRVLEGEFGPGVESRCAGPGRDGPPELRASIFATSPAIGDPGDWKGAPHVERAVGGQESGFAAPARLTNSLELPRDGEYELSLQYHSQVPLTVRVAGEEIARLPPTLEGMYLDGAGRGAFWPAGSFEAAHGRALVSVEAAKPGGIEGALGGERRLWLGVVAATALGDPRPELAAAPCGYVDHFTPLGTASDAEASR